MYFFQRVYIYLSRIENVSCTESDSEYVTAALTHLYILVLVPEPLLLMHFNLNLSMDEYPYAQLSAGWNFLSLP